MKKLMFGAAIAATSMVFAATPEEQVYDVSLSIKTTAAASAKLNNKTNPFVGEETETVVYRKQASATWKGLIWGCDCEAIDGVWEDVVDYESISTIKGCILWDAKTKKPVFVGDGSDLSDAESAQGNGFGWQFLNAIDKNGKKVEGAWAMTQDGLACGDTYTLFSFAGAGFGTLQLNTTDGAVDCTSYVKSISGNFAGWMKAPNASTADDWSGCTFCGYEPVYGECEFATAWNYCDCDDYLDEEKTAAYGTWKVAYNSGVSKKLSKQPAVTQEGIDNLIVSIRQVYNFPTAVAAAILAIENTFWQFDPTGCDELSVALAAANKAVEEAKAAVEASKYENLKDAEDKAAAKYGTASNDYDVAVGKQEIAAGVYKAAAEANADAWANQTNCTWTLVYTNATRDAVSVNGVGCEKLETAVKEYNQFTLGECDIYIPRPMPGITTNCTSWTEVGNVITKLEAATIATTREAVAAELALADAAEDVANAYTAKQVADDAYTAAQNDLANINLLQYKAEVQLEKAEAAQAVAQAAYDDAGCND